MSRAQSQIDAWLDDPSPEPTTTRTQIDWDALESAVRPLAEHEKLVWGHVIVEHQHEQTSRLVDDTGKETVERATADGHDYSDCGGDDQ